MEWGATTDRWLAADRAGRELEADAEFGRLLHGVTLMAPSEDLEDRIWRATRFVRLRARARVTLRRSGTVAAGVLLSAAAVYVATIVVVPLAARTLARSAEWLVRGVVWMTVAFAEGMDTWSFLATMGRAVATALATPEATTALIVLELIAAVAFYALNRVLGGEKEISQ